LRQQDKHYLIEGSAGTLTVASDDEVALKLAMLIEGECEGLGPTRAAKKYGYSPQRYFQLRKRYTAHGTDGLSITPPTSINFDNITKTSPPNSNGMSLTHASHGSTTSNLTSASNDRKRQINFRR
jgi:Homeodomain-like domain-containing protein